MVVNIHVQKVKTAFSMHLMCSQEKGDHDSCQYQHMDRLMIVLVKSEELLNGL